MRRAALCLVAAVALTSCGKKGHNNEPIVGWHNANEEVWPAACYYPPNFDEMGPGDRRMARQKVLEEMKSQWKGDKDSVVSFDAEDIDTMETVLLGKPELIEQVAVDNLDRCKGAMESGGQTISWSKWLRDTPVKLTEGECRNAPLDYTLFDYLDIGREWQIKAYVCREDHVRISGSPQDYYRLSDKGPWINVEGDPDKATTTTDYPCTLAGCKAGMLIMRFTDDNGFQEIIPIGAEREWTAPNHGYIEVMINDNGTWYDNKYRIKGSIEDHTSITYAGDVE